MPEPTLTEEITPEELDEGADCAARGEDLRSTRVETTYRRAAATICTLQARVWEAEKRAVPEGWMPLCIVPDDDTLTEERAFSVERSTKSGNESRWCVFFGERRIGDPMGYETLTDAMRAAQTAAEEADHAD